MTDKCHIKDEAIIELIKDFIASFRQFINLGRNETNRLNEVSGNMQRDVQGNIEAIIAFSDRYYRGEDIGLASAHHWAENDFIKSLEKSCKEHINLAIHDKHYFDALINAVTVPIKQGKIMPVPLRNFNSDVISRP